MACTGVVTFKCTPNLADLGAGKNYWWGGEFEFIFTPVGGGMAVEVRPVGNFTKKLTEVIR